MVIVTHSCIPFLVVRKHHLKGISAVSHFFFVLHLDCKFKRLKNEMFCGRSWIEVSSDDFAQELDDHINWYNRKRIKLSLGGLSPIEYRQRLGCAV